MVVRLNLLKLPLFTTWSVYQLLCLLWLQPGQKVAILGAGPIGLVSMMVAKSFGAAVIVVTDISDERLKVAAEVRDLSRGGTGTFRALDTTC